MSGLVEQLSREHILDADGFKSLLSCNDEAVINNLHERARKVADEVFGRKVFFADWWKSAIIARTTVSTADCGATTERLPDIVSRPKKS